VERGRAPRRRQTGRREPAPSGGGELVVLRAPPAGVRNGRPTADAKPVEGPQDERLWPLRSCTRLQFVQRRGRSGEERTGVSLPSSSTGGPGRAGFLTADAALILPLAQRCPTRRAVAVQWLIQHTTPLAVKRVQPRTTYCRWQSESRRGSWLLRGTSTVNYGVTR